MQSKRNTYSVMKHYGKYLNPTQWIELRKHCLSKLMEYAELPDNKKQSTTKQKAAHYQAWFIILFFIITAGQRREVIVNMSSNTLEWDSQGRACIHPQTEKVIRKMRVIALEEVLTLAAAFQVQF